MEAEATGRAVRLGEFAGAPVFVVHVSCRQRGGGDHRARVRAGPPPTARRASSTSSTRSTTSAGPTSSARATSARRRCATPSTRRFLWDALRLDHLQLVSTDHCPFNDEQKRLGLGDFSKIPNGLAAIQHRLPMLWEHGVRERPAVDEPRRRDHVDGGRARCSGCIRARARSRPAPTPTSSSSTRTAATCSRRTTSFMNVDYDIYEGREVAGSPRLTLSRGTVVFDDGRILHLAGPRPLRAPGAVRRLARVEKRAVRRCPRARAAARRRCRRTTARTARASSRAARRAAATRRGG